jgi:translation initiation factor 2 subunit 1
VLAAGRKLTPQEVRIRALFDLQCFASDGVVAIKEAVAAVQAASADQGLTIKVISAPQFLVETSGIGREACEARLLAALDKLKTEMEKRGGVYRLRAAPEVIGEDEEALPKFEDEDYSSDDAEEDVEHSEGESDDSSSSSSSSSSSEDEAEKRRRSKKDKKGRK